MVSADDQQLPDDFSTLYENVGLCQTEVWAVVCGVTATLKRKQVLYTAVSLTHPA